jgi:hypothetical protein
MEQIAEAEDRQTVTINGVPRVFRYLNTAGKVSLIREFRKQKKTALAESLKLADVPAEQKLVELNALDERPESDWMNWIKDMEGGLVALRLSLEKTYPGEGENILRETYFSDDDVFILALKVCRLRIAEQPPAADSNATDQAATPAPATTQAT